MAEAGSRAGEPPRDNEASAKKTRVGGYEILGRLGTGGMGAVFKARQVSMDRIVALKILSPQLAQDRTYVERFLREARSAAKLSHPHIVQGIDVGRAGQYYYFAMEFVDGRTVRDLIRREGPIDEKRALHIIRGIAAALEHAHKHGIIHRDIKPDNIMINSEGVVKLADLGLARSVEQVDTVTIDGSALGTPHYMSPEQARGEADLDTRADIYAVGATLYHMVTGECPFDAPTAAAIMAKHITEPVPSPKEKNPGLSRGLCDLVQHMMAKDRDQRPHDPTELLAEIQNALEGKVKLRTTPAAGAGRPATSRAGRPATRAPRHPKPQATPSRKLLTAAVAGGVALLVVALIWLATRGGRPHQPPPPDPGAQAALAAAEAAKCVEQLERKKAALAAKAQAAAQLESVLERLRADTRALIGDDRFGEAGTRVNRFGKEHTSPAAADETAKLRREIRAGAEERYGELARAAETAVEQKDFAKARDALRPIASFGVPELARRAKEKLAAIESLEKATEQRARWEDVKTRVGKLVQAGRFDEATKLLDAAGTLPLENIAALVAEQRQAIDAARRRVVDAAVSAYEKQSDKVWALFRARKYADAAAAKLLRQFWAAVEKGVAARKGRFVSIAGTGGNVVGVRDGKVTLRAGKAEYLRRVHELDLKQALAYAALGDDTRSKRMLGVLLLAEGKKLGEAEKTLAGAGESPTAAIYRNRLAALKRAAQEVTDRQATAKRERAAQAAWREIQRAAEGTLTPSRARRVLATIDGFCASYAGTRAVDAAREKIARLRESAEEAAATWVRLFDGTDATAKQWKKARFSGIDSPTYATRERIVIDVGTPDSGLFWFGDFPRDSYELTMEAMRIAGNEDFGSITFPLAAGNCRLVLGGYDGTVVALSKVDGARGDKNATTHRIGFKNEQWYQVRLRVRQNTIEVWVDGKKAISQARAGHRFEADVGLSARRLLICTVNTKAALRNIRYRCFDQKPPLVADSMTPRPPGSLFDGKTLGGWEPIDTFPMDPQYGSGKGGRVRIEDGQIILEAGEPITGILWTRPVPSAFELSLEAKRIAGDHGFCNITFPVGTSFCTLATGPGPDSPLMGLDEVDGQTGNRNVTTRRVTLNQGTWYRFRLEVTPGRVRAWLDQDKVIDLETGNHKLTARNCTVPLRPLGINNCQANTALRNITLRPLPRGPAASLPHGEAVSLFDGKSLRGWRTVDRFPTQAGSGKGGAARAQQGQIVLEPGDPYAGIVWTGEHPVADYELNLEMASFTPAEHLGTIVVPVGTSHKGIRISAAVQDGGEPSAPVRWPADRWCRVRVRVTRAAAGKVRVEVWCRGEKSIDQTKPPLEYAVVGALALVRPLGVCITKTGLALRNITLRQLR